MGVMLLKRQRSLSGALFSEAVAFELPFDPPRIFC
jgi:hypothetical protein